AIWVELRIRLAAPAEVERARDEAVRVWEEARSCCGPSLTIDRLRRDLVKVQGGIELVPETGPAPRSAADHYDLGRSYLREQRYRAALNEFRHTLDQRPLDFWSNFYQGLCSYRLGEFPDAFAA